ncbi:hypothetical protein D9M72_514390 [compost metagenome]
MPGMTYCAAVTDPRSTRRYTESVRARLALVTLAFSQLSTVANRQAKQMPASSRIRNHISGLMTSTIEMAAAEAIAAMAEKVRMWPMARSMRVT